MGIAGWLIQRDIRRRLAAEREAARREEAMALRCREVTALENLAQVLATEVTVINAAQRAVVPDGLSNPRASVVNAPK